MTARAVCRYVLQMRDLFLPELRRLRAERQLAESSPVPTGMGLPRVPPPPLASGAGPHKPQRTSALLLNASLALESVTSHPLPGDSWNFDALIGELRHRAEAFGRADAVLNDLL